jgi:hypothetical protein
MHYYLLENDLALVVADTGDLVEAEFALRVQLQCQRVVRTSAGAMAPLQTHSCKKCQLLYFVDIILIYRLFFSILTRIRKTKELKQIPSGNWA